MAWILRIVALVAAVVAADAARAQAPAQPDAMLILDASNSMWGRVDGRPKIVVARNAVAALLRALPRGTRIGLMAYGHRRTGDCSDIETVVPVGPVEAGAMATRVNALTPRGRTPLSEAVRQAARELRASERPARVILVSDGIETCNADPCAVAAELRASGVDFVTHVIGFDVADPRDQAQLRCLAEGTGGRFIAASDAGSLAAALADVTATQPPARAAAAPPRPTGITNLTLEAVEVEGGRVLPGLLWWLDSTDDPPRSIIANSGAARPSVSVPAGRYRVRAQSGNARVVETFTASGQRQTYRVVMNVGRLHLTGALAAGSPAGIPGLWSLFADEVPGFRPGERVAANIGATRPELTLVQGSYRVNFVTGAASATAEVFVPAAQTVSAQLDLDAGRASLAARRAGQMLGGGVLWEIHRRAADGTRTRVHSSGAARPTITLPAGDYVARTFRAGTWTEQPFSLAAGQVATVTVELP